MASFKVQGRNEDGKIENLRFTTSSIEEARAKAVANGYTVEWIAEVSEGDASSTGAAVANDVTRIRVATEKMQRQQGWPWWKVLIGLVVGAIVVLLALSYGMTGRIQ